MSSPQQVVVVCTGRTAERFMEQLIESEGYEVRRVFSAADILAEADHAPKTAQAILFRTDVGSGVETLLREAADNMPDVKFVIVAPESHGGSAAFFAQIAQSERGIWVQEEAISPETGQEIRTFLRGDGYQWASDLMPWVGHGADLLESAGGYAETREEIKDKVLAFSDAISGHTDLVTLLQEGLRQYLEILRCDAGSIYVWDEHSQALILKAAEGPDRSRRMGLRQKLGEGVAGWVAEVGESVLIADTRKVHKLHGRVCRRYSNFSCLAMPIWHGEHLVGVICLTMPRDGESFKPMDLRLAQTLSRKLGSMVHLVELLSDLRGFGERLEDVLKSCSALATEKDAEVEEMRTLSGHILDGIPVGIISYDRTLCSCSANAMARELFGITPAGPRRDPSVPLEDSLVLEPAEWRGRLRAVLEDGEGFRLQRVEYRGNGQTRLVDIRCSPLLDGEGVCLGGVLTVEDVTEDVVMEERLSSAERLALIGKIAAKVAHELNNPLDGILRFLGLAERTMEDTPDRARSYLQEARGGLLRMSNILTQLLAFSRSYRRAGQPVSLSQIIRDSLALYEERARSANTKVSVDIPADLPPCETAELCEVFSNVLKNALDAMESGGRLTVEAAREDAHVRVAIADTGPGIPEDIHDKIFEPFFSTKKDGTGLGLAACRDTLHKIGGDIRLCPSEQGATFEITIPLEQPAG